MILDSTNGKACNVDDDGNERKNSIISTIEREKEKATRLEEEKQIALATIDAFKPTIPHVKKMKLKPLKLNPDFVREMAAATSYRDPFYERIQLAKLTKKVDYSIIIHEFYLWFILTLFVGVFCLIILQFTPNIVRI